MHSTLDVRQEWAGASRSIARLFELRQTLGPACTRVAAAVSAWTPNQHLFHISLATDMGLRSAMSIVKGKSPLVQLEGEPNELAASVFAKRAYPRGQSQSPRMVQPPSDVEQEFVETELANAAAAVANVEIELDAIDTAPGRIEHPLLGALNAREWLLFVNLHAAHHVAILEDMAAAFASE